MPAAALAESCAGRNRSFTSKRKYAWERLCAPFAGFDAAGYPLGEDGSCGLSLTVSCASSSVNTNILSMVQTDLAACGVDLQI